MALAQRDAAELVADRKPLYLQLTAGDKGSHFLLIEVKWVERWNQLRHLASCFCPASSHCYNQCAAICCARWHERSSQLAEACCANG